MKLIPILSLFCGISLLATSCASFPSNRVKQVSSLPRGNAKKVSLSYSLKSAIGNMQGSRQDSSALIAEAVSKPLVNAANHSDRFSSVSTAKGGDVRLDVDMLNYGNSGLAAVSGFISGLSMFVLPGVGADNFKLTATARNSAGLSKTYLIDDGVNTIIWLPMIFAMATNNPTEVIPNVQENMYLELFQQMAADGIIPK